jgi:mono/diheme cytochrome c family protein
MSAAALVVLLGAALQAPADGAAHPAEGLAAAAPFFAEHCVKCHGPTKQKGHLRLDVLVFEPASDANLETWLAVSERLTASEMPPEEEPRPDPAPVSALVAAIRDAVAGAAEATREPAPLRRLNRAQYRNTLRDLLALDVLARDPTAAFPADDALEGFDNLGAGLTLSDYLLRQYLVAARAAVDQATFDGPRPEVRTHRMLDPEETRVWSFEVNHSQPGPDGVFLFMNDERSPGDPRGQVLTTSRDGAPSAGPYEFTFELESRGRGKLPAELAREVRAEWQVYQPGDLHRLELYLSAPFGSAPLQTRQRVLVESLDLPDGERVTLTRRYFLPRGWRLELAFGNAWTGHLATFVEVLGGDMQGFEALPRLERFEFLARQTHALVARADAPRIVIHAASERGPLHEEWPPASQRLVHGAPGTPLEEHLLAFATRAFRRPVAAETLTPYLELARTSPEGLRTAIEALLCSPRFLYLQEEPGELDGYALAARLSYFLWSTMPDERLLAAAAPGSGGEPCALAAPGALAAEARRMLADPRSQELVTHFLWGWLGLQNTRDMEPDPMRFPAYHRGRVDTAMVRETELFFRGLLDENGPLTRLLDADYTFVNAELARHYGLAPVPTTVGFARVALPPELRRGGLLGQAAVLTASGNGVDTSPVVRGIWVLEKLLDMPPDAPPPGVVAPDPDTRGELTIRELFGKHRTDASCNECHADIDPPGFALETFDAVGRWRDHYENGAAIDPSGELPGGDTFEDVRGLKRALLAAPEPFARALASKLLTYASGRTLGPLDHAEVEHIVDELAARGYGLRDLVELVVESRVFRTR